MYVDIHTHARTHDPRIREIQVLDPRIPLELSLQSAQAFCYGLHPWYVDEISDDIFNMGLKSAVQSQGFFALGEIGLDRARAENFEKQLEEFRKQLSFAERFRVGRIVLHCVRAHFDILPEVKKLRHRPILIWHDFNANIETAQAILESTDSYFSFGARLFKSDSKAVDTYQKLGLDKIFFETDDQLDKSILDVYAQAAKIREIPEKELIDQVERNFKGIDPSQIN